MQAHVQDPKLFDCRGEDLNPFDRSTLRVQTTPIQGAYGFCIRNHNYDFG